MQTVVETPAYLSDAKALGLAEAQRDFIVAWIAANPDAGDVIQGTGGARKVRFAGKGKGKRGGYRVITFYAGTRMPTFLLNMFAKNEKTDLTPRERKTLKSVLSDLVNAYRARNEKP